jgi:hypothetical protein
MRRTGNLLAAALLLAVPVASHSSEDPLEKEYARLAAYVRDNKATDDNWQQLKGAVTPALDTAGKALKSGHRLYALARTAAALGYISAARWIEELPASQKSDAGFQAQWAKLGKELAPELKPPSPTTYQDLSPAAVRALAEASLQQVKGLYDASLEYGLATEVRFGLMNLGIARAQREQVALFRAASRKEALTPPPLRPLDDEIDALQKELLAAYRPPVSVDHHPDFIGANSTLNEARQLNDAGLLEGALLRYLQAAVRLGMLKTPAPTIDAPTLTAKLDEVSARLKQGGVDNSIGLYFVDAAATEGAGPLAAAVVSDVFPRYFAALEPAKAAPPRPKPEVTVTLVRWPYT